VRKGSYPAARGHEDEWLADTVRLHLTAGRSFEQHLANGVWVLVTNKRLSNGWLAGLRVDITSLKDIEAALADSEEQFRQVVEAVPNGIVLVAGDGRIAMLNSAVEQAFGYPRDELLGQPIETLVPERYRAAHPRLRDSFTTAPRARAMGAGRELFGRRKDGSEFPVEVGLNPVETKEGPMVLAAIVDITERLKIEAERRQTDQHLQDLQSELIHVSRLSTMGQMASTLAHELNQPLTAVSSYLQGLKRLAQAELDPARAIDVIDRTVAQAARAGEVIRRLRDFVAKGETDRQPENLNDVVEEAVSLAMVGARQSGVILSLQFDPELPPVLIDKVQIQQVVLNLVRNAIEAMEGGERRELTIATRSGVFAEITVTDTGPGIAPEVAARLFQPFTTTKKSGMGVGLSICREIVEAHGGRITTAANTPTGTVFRVTLPTITNDGLDDNAGC